MCADDQAEGVGSIWMSDIVYYASCWATGVSVLRKGSQSEEKQEKMIDGVIKGRETIK
jgi:hypothetical protein